ncbi:MAG: ornithine cyclodeaminase [Hyphomicrobiales bacterium]|nr:MAG: ornithine cyclodeaminase [Hyphomicrobiales bacterium]
MRMMSAEETRAALAWRPLVEALRAMFASGCDMPVRHHHDFTVPGEPDGTLLLMPAWQVGEHLGVKIVNVVPGNADRGMAAISAVYLLSDAKTGVMQAMVDGGELTARRTAAASALAADYLARKDAKRLLVVGTGRLSVNLVEAHASVRDIDEVVIWGRNADKAAAIAESVAKLGFRAEAASDLAEAVAGADIVSAATLSTEPLVMGEWLTPGTHVDLVGGFKPTMREADDEAVRRARVFVDTRAGATKEAGDIVVPLQTGALAMEDIAADLYDLTRGKHAGRASDDEITLFKSVGAALEDLAGAVLAYRTATGEAE